ALQSMRGKRVGIVGAAGGRGLLDRELATRGARIAHAYVYRRVPARLDGRHAESLRRAAGKPSYVLLSSAEALANILARLPEDVRPILLAGTAVVSSERLAAIAHHAGFAQVLHAGSAHAAALLAAVVADRGLS
ncbi:MAG: uroporphyrinogen-III synthase, partial [Rhodanobacteraceae bacterium]